MSATGCIREPRGAGRGEPVGRLLGAGAPAPQDVDLRHLLVGRRIVQRGQGCAPSSAHMALRMMAPAPIETSWTATYSILRQLERGYDQQGPLADEGSRLSRVVESLEGWGICSDARWSNQVDLRERVTADVLEAGQVATIAGIYQIDATGDRWRAQARAALAKGHPILYGSSIGPSYRAGPNGGVYFGDPRPEDVGHARILIAARLGAFLEANPWGQAWDRWIDETWLAESGEAWGFYAFGGITPTARVT